MKTTTFAPMKVGKNQTLLPSGVKASKDGKYRYWQCSVSGLSTFAKPDYWVQIMAKYKTEENLVKTYVCRKAQKLLAVGKTQAEIIDIFSKPATTEAKKYRQAVKAEKKARAQVMKKPRKVRLKKFAVGKVEVSVTTDSGSVEIQKVPVYPWQGNPDYFKGSGDTKLSIADATVASCAMPGRYLDDECRNCPLYAECAFEKKYTAEDWKKPRKNNSPKITKIDSFNV